MRKITGLQRCGSFEPVFKAELFFFLLFLSCILFMFVLLLGIYLRDIR